MNGKIDPPFAFLSSLVKEHRPEREQVHELGLKLGRRVWVDEIDHPRDSGDDPLATVDDLLRTIDEAELFICVLGGPRHGSPLEIGGREARASYFEMELYYAALRQKPIHLFVLEGFQPQPALAELLEVLSFALPRKLRVKEVSRGSVVQKIGRVLRRGRASSVGDSLLRRLVERLYWARGGPTRRNDLLFLGHQFGSVRSPDLDLVRDALVRAKSAEEEGQRLSRLWVAMRELMGAHPESTDDVQVLRLWNQVLGRWGGAGAWYGLHGHIHLGCLAAFRSVSKVRERLRGLVGDGEPGIDHPGGALGSALYSIAKKTWRRSTRRRILREAIDELEACLGSGQGNRSNLLAIRGSVLLQLRQVSAAVEDYEEVVRLRRVEGRSAALGEALAELGFGYVRQVRLSKGRDLIREGVTLLSSEGGVGFLVRAKRKLALAEAACGNLPAAVREREEARELALKHGVLDQLRQV